MHCLLVHHCVCLCCYIPVVSLYFWLLLLHMWHDIDFHYTWAHWWWLCVLLHVLIIKMDFLFTTVCTMLKLWIWIYITISVNYWTVPELHINVSRYMVNTHPQSPEFVLPSQNKEFTCACTWQLIGIFSYRHSNVLSWTEHIITCIMKSAHNCHFRCTLWMMGCFRNP